MKSFLFLILFFLSFSCGRSNSRAGYPIKEYVPHYDALEGIQLDKLYLVQLFPLFNPGNISSPKGTSVISLTKGRIFVDIKLENTSPHTRFLHNIYTGDRCPREKDDINQDGYLDAVEMKAVTGPVYYPIILDRPGEASDALGVYTYSLEDIYEKAIDFEGNVLIVLGAPDTTELPETVRGEIHRLPHETLPIACGIVKRVTEVPEDSPELGTIPRGPQETSTEPTEGRSWYERVINWWRTSRGIQEDRVRD